MAADKKWKSPKETNKWYISGGWFDTLTKVFFTTLHSDSYQNAEIDTNVECISHLYSVSMMLNGCELNGLQWLHKLKHDLYRSHDDTCIVQNRIAWQSYGKLRVKRT